MGLFVVLLASAPTRATLGDSYRLPELLRLARKRHASLAVARAEHDTYEAKALQARLAWLPRGTLDGRVAPAPEIRCDPDFVPDLDENGAIRRDSNGAARWLPGDSATQAQREQFCVATSERNVTLSFAGISARIVLEAGMPLYTFGKLTALRRAARAGVSLTRAGVAAAGASLSLSLKRAYWGLRLALETGRALRVARRQLERARRRLERDLDDGSAEETLSDLLRLDTALATARADLLETDRLAGVGRATLAALTGIALDKLEVDGHGFATPKRRLEPLERYRARLVASRPELAQLRAAERASAAQTALRVAQFLPDILLVGTFGIGATTSVDDPQLGFASDPFNFRRAALALALEWAVEPIDKLAALGEAKAASKQLDAKTREARLGMEIQLRQAHGALTEALERERVSSRAQSVGRRWLIASLQNSLVGLLEPGQLRDAISAFSSRQVQHLRAIHDVQVGWAELDGALGSDDPP